MLFIAANLYIKFLKNAHVIPLYQKNLNTVSGNEGKDKDKRTILNTNRF